MTPTLLDFSNLCKTRLEKIFSHHLKTVPSPALKQAMEYTLSNGGKRIRPLLVYATGSLFNAHSDNLDMAAAAIELIHTYSLIHDDLPCMDNSDLRRGKPTCHKIAGEAMAVLTGDALQTLAFQLIAEHPAPLTPTNRLAMVRVLAKAAGPNGMAAGQALDMTEMQTTISPSLLEQIYELKTGALLSAAVELGLLASVDIDPNTHASLIHFSRLIGLAFQIQDDILDLEMETESLGKPQGLDIQNNKTTYPRLHGHDLAKEKVEALYQEAVSILMPFGGEALLLQELMAYLLKRRK